MKKLYYYFILMALSCGIIASCQKDEFNVVDSQVNSNVVLTAILENGPATRTQLTPNDNNGYKMLWSEGDALSVFNSTSTHAKFVLSSGAGKENANFNMTEGSLSFGTEGSNNSFGVVGVYPYSANTTVSKEGANYLINTEIPAKQEYAANSFGTNASPMIGVHSVSYNLSFKNVGTVLVMPLKGNATIKSATLESKAHKIAGSAIVSVDETNGNIPVAEITENGVSLIELSCGTGVELSETEATKFFFVLAPGIYEANDLVVTFYDSFGNYFATEITKEIDFVRSITNTFKARDFETQGTTEMDLWIRAEAGAYMQAERIIPSLENIDVQTWAKNLKDKENTKALIEEAVAYIGLKNYKAAYEVLGGIPGFVKETKMFEAKGSYTQKVDYTGTSYLVSMLEDIEKINDIQTLLDFMKEFENIYEGSGLKNKLDESLGSIADNFDAYIDAYIDASVNQKPDENLSEEEALAAYKAKIKEQLERSLTVFDIALGLIKEKHAGIPNPLFNPNKPESWWNKKWVTEPDPSFMIDEYNSIKAYLASANDLLVELDALATKEDVEAKVKAIDPIKIEVQSIGFSEEINPETWLTGADAAYEDKLKEQIASNTTLINSLKAGLRTAIQEISSQSLVESLEIAINEPNSTTGKVLNYLFAQESFMNTVKESLHTIVAEIEEKSKEDINEGNVDQKIAAINAAKTNAIIYARAEAGQTIKDNFAQTNQTNLNNLYAGPWGYFQKVLNWSECIKAFEKLDILQVYDALVDLSKVVEEMIAYDNGAIYYNIEEIENYQENVDWWIIEAAPAI